MIVETMSKEEIVKKFRKDWNGQLHYVIQAELGSSKYRRFILKNLSSEKEYYFKPIYFESSSGINYVILPNTKGKRDFKKYGLLYTVFLFFERKDGIHTMMAIRRNSWDVFNRYVFYTPHFFDRYRERFLKDIHIDKMDAILSFYKHNATSMIERLDNPQYVNSIFSATKQGVQLGCQYSDEIVEMKTFISFEMLKGQQIERKEDLANIVNDYMNKVQ